MFDPLDFENRKHFDRLGRLRLLTRFFMSLERFVSAFWLPLVWCLFFCALWLLNAPPALGRFGPEVTAILFLIGLGYILYQNIKEFHWPSHPETNRRLEKDNKLKHRPLSQIDDRLANPDLDKTKTLWRAREWRIIRILKLLNLPSLKPVIAKRDPYALRMGVLTLFLTGFIVAGQSWPEKLKSGVFPFSFQVPGHNNDSAFVTITPPEYTRTTPITLKGIHRGDPIEIPEGSTIKAQVNGGIGLPQLVIGDTTSDFTVLNNKSYGIVKTITDGNLIQIKQFFIRRLHSPFMLIEDAPPQISLSGEHEQTEYKALRFALKVSDDYGLKDLHMRMDLDPVVIDSPLGEPVVETRALVTRANEETEIKPVYDLTSHVWAGLPAIISFEAEDGAGQKTGLKIKLSLPEREFKHPISKKLIEHRKALAWNYQTSPDEIIASLEEILTQPEEYNYDISILLALRTASSRLAYSPGEETARALIDLFWSVAIHLEDGDLSLARQRLQDAQRALENALNDPDTTSEEMAELVESLRQAMAEYFRELGREMQKQLAEGQNMPLLQPDMLNQLLNPEDIAKFFDQLESEALSGDADKARELLSQLNQLMDTLDPSMTMTMPMDMQMMSEGINEIQELIRRQEELLDQTRAQADKLNMEFNYGELLPDDPNSPVQLEGLPPAPQSIPQAQPKSFVDTGLNKVEQEALRYILGQLMLDADSVLGEIPENMELAEQEMRQSSNALGANRPDLSIPSQEQAIEYLREAMKNLSQQMMARMKQMTGFMLGQGQTDPLGRRTGQNNGGNNWYNGSEVQIPDEAERKKVEEILKLLRKKSGEFNRPDYELDYYRRLLKQF